MLACRGGLLTVGLKSPFVRGDDVEKKPLLRPSLRPFKPRVNMLVKREGLEECGLPTLLSWGVPWPDIVRR